MKEILTQLELQWFVFLNRIHRLDDSKCFLPRPLTCVSLESFTVTIMYSTVQLLEAIHFSCLEKALEAVLFFVFEYISFVTLFLARIKLES